MFGFLKEKLRNAAKIFSKKVEEEGQEVKQPVGELEEALEIEEPFVQETQKQEEKAAEKEKSRKKQKAHLKKKVAEKKKGLEEDSEHPQEIILSAEEKKEFAPPPEDEFINEPEEKRGWFTRLREKVAEKVTTTKIDAEQFEDFFQELEYALLENNVAAEVIEKIKDDLKQELVEKPLKKGKVEQLIEEGLSESIREVLRESDFDLLKAVRGKQEKPYVILFVGVNGSGKTTTIAKIAHLLKQNHLTSVLVAGDTWRKAAIEQLEEHGKKLGLKVIKHQYGSDPAAVAYDGVSFCKAHHVDAVLVDTAGRQHSNQNLMKEMEKIVRVIRPDLKLFVGEAITGNDVVEQTRRFNEAIEIDGIILTKSDVDEKGGAILSARYVTQKPILFLGVGQNLEDLKVFDKKEVITSLGF